MKRFFTKLFFAAFLFATPFVFTSCDGLLGSLEDILEDMENEYLDKDGEDDEENSGGEENNPSDTPVLGEAEIIEVECIGLDNVNLLELCVNLTHEYKYTVNGLQECDWARVEWREYLDGNRWTPLLTVDENTTGETRAVQIEIFLGENLVCQHTIYQY